MGLIIKDNGGPAQEPIPEGTHVACVEKIVDLGTHYSELAKKDQHQLIVVYWIAEEDRRISKTYTLSMNEKASLRKHFEGIAGKAFSAKDLAEGIDIMSFAGRGCQVSIVHVEKNGKTYANISGVVSLPKGLKAQAPKESTVVYTIGVDPDDILEKLPDWMQDKIMKSKEWIERGMVDQGEDAAPAEGEEEVPF